MKKRILAIVCCAVMLLLAGCGSKTTEPEQGQENGENTNTVENFKPQKIVISHNSASSNPEPTALAWFAEELEKRTDGNITCETFFDGVLGSETETMDQMTEGTIQISIFGTSLMDKYAPEYAVFSVPYLFGDLDHIKACWDGPIGEAIYEKLAENNIMVTGYVYKGNRQLTCNRAVQTPDDLKGMKIRMAENPTFITVWKALCTLPTVIPASESYTALQNHVVEAQENPIITNNNRCFYEVQDYTILTNHYVDFSRVAICKSWFESLPQEYQDIILELAQETGEMSTKIVNDNEAAARANQEEHGMEFLTVDEKPFREVAMSVLPEIAENWADGVYEQAMKDAGLDA